MRIDVGFVARPCRGEVLSGDAVVVRKEQDTYLLAVIDALGHGGKAAAVAEQSRGYLESVDVGIGLAGVVEGLDQALRGSRGAAATVCLLGGGRVVGCGVGNVEIRFQGDSVPAVLSPGILGARVRKLRVFEGSVRPGTRIAMFSDGLSARTSLASVRTQAPQVACEQLVERFWRPHDDGTILIVDVVG